MTTAERELVERELGGMVCELERLCLGNIAVALCAASLDDLARAAAQLRNVDAERADLVRRIYHRRLNMARARLPR